MNFDAEVVSLDKSIFLIFFDLSTLLTFSYVLRPQPKRLRYWTSEISSHLREALQKFFSSSPWIEVQIFLCFRDPIRYFNSTKGRNLTKMVICKYILPILVISLLANSPTLFEFQVLTQSQVTKKFDPVANQTLEVDYLKLVGLTFIYIAQKLFSDMWSCLLCGGNVAEVQSILRHLLQKFCQIFSFWCFTVHYSGDSQLENLLLHPKFRSPLSKLDVQATFGSVCHLFSVPDYPFSTHNLGISSADLSRAIR